MKKQKKKPIAWEKTEDYKRHKKTMENIDKDMINLLKEVR